MTHDSSTPPGEAGTAHDQPPRQDADEKQTTPFLSAAHLQQLRDSGLNDETIARAELYTESNQAVVHSYLNWRPPSKRGRPGHGLSDCLVFPCYQPGAESPYAYRVKPSNPRTEKRKGKERELKYESPRDAGVIVYYSPRTRAERLQTGERLIWTEGEKKALLLDQLGYPVIGLTGVWNAHDPSVRNPEGKPKKSGPFVLHPRITEHVRIADRDHVILFDADARQKPDVMHAARVLKSMLLEKGARSVQLALPPKGGGKGIDDYYVEVERSGESGADAVAEVVRTAGDVPAQEAWREGLIVGERDAPRTMLANVMTVFALHPELEGVLAYDDFRQAVVKQRKPPVREQDGESELGEWTEEDSTRAAAWFATVVGFEPHPKMIVQAVAAIAKKTRVHPVRDYLRGLKWDGVSRLDTMLSTYFGADNTPYTRAIGPRWMISGVARSEKPGCQVDCMLVLEGMQQGEGKSRGLRELVGEDWYADTRITLGDKDSYQALRGKWLYEFSELDAFKGRESTRVKNFVSSSVDNYRPSYGDRNRDFPRQCIFAGTTNEEHYLVDSTGNRRFWPVRCGEVKLDLLRRDRDQLWAEARERYEAGEPWHVDTPELRRLCEAEQAEREVEEPWLALIEPWLDNPARRHSGVTTAEVMAGALKLELRDMNDQRAKTTVGTVLHRLGWLVRRPRSKSGDGAGESPSATGRRRPPRRYFPPPAAEDGGPSRSTWSTPDHPAKSEGVDHKEPLNSPREHHESSSGPPGPPVCSVYVETEQCTAPEEVPGAVNTHLRTPGSGFRGGPGGPGTPADSHEVIQSDAELTAFAKQWLRNRAELAELALPPDQANGMPLGRPTLPGMVGDWAAYYLSHPRALERDAGFIGDTELGGAP